MLGGGGGGGLEEGPTGELELEVEEKLEGKLEEILLLGSALDPGARQGVVSRCSKPS